MNFVDDLFCFENNCVTCGLTNELNVFYVLGLFKKTNKNIIVLTSSLYEANNYYNLFQTYDNNVLLYVCDDFLSTVQAAASPELKLVRLNTLEKIKSGKHIIITNLMGYLSFLPDKNKKNTFGENLTINSSISRNALIETLINIGYHQESLTTTTGEYSIRGMILDIFPINEKHPIRIEFDGDLVEDIRYFDEIDQHSLNKIEKCVINPVDEIITENHSSLVDYLDEPCIVYIDYPQIKASYKKLVGDIFEFQQNGRLSNEKCMFEFDEIKVKYELQLNNFVSNKSDLNIDCKSINNYNSNFDLLINDYQKWVNEKKHVIFFISNINAQKELRKLIPSAKILNKKINHGFIISDYVFISEYDIEEVKRNYKYQNSLYGGKRIVDYNELKKGDYVVHISHGIGIYNGIVTLSKNMVKKDYIQLIYQNNDKIYVPVEKISNIYKYSDKEGSIPKLDRLNSSTWLTTKQYIKKKIEDISKELMVLYNNRAKIKRKPYLDYEEEIIFDSEFVYSLTADQEKAITDINNDLKSDHPMDRLLCGDVGFGKTEVAMRAMFKSVINNQQVAYLCPTTILSTQQYNVIKSRFASWPIEVALVNRFTSQKEFTKIVEGLKKGSIDIVVGTHKLLNNTIKYKDLGLLVIDEEQRFGVKHKEKIKELKNDINVLTLSATPIPRTLKMAMSGLRDLSIIDTAPVNRYPIQTYVMGEDDYIIKDAIYKELSRNGQVFILYNSVENMDNKTTAIRKLIPDQEIRSAHGQMNKTELESIMEDFYEHKFSILICTTIIESGIDIPNANTLIVLDADKLGLAQLYQLRGRVGRSDRIAYAYLMYNNNKLLNEIAIKRLQSIKEFTSLGSGYRIAMRDLSIRGAGDIFGSSQAGFVDTVGVALYTKMLEDELKRQKGEYIEDDEEETSLINIDTHIDDSYVSDEDIKIEIHKMINTIDTYDKLINIKSELEDRFGKISSNLEIYLYEEWFEKVAKKLEIKKVVQNDRFIEIELPEKLSQNIKGDKLLYTAFNISKSFNLSYRHKCIIITLYYKNLPDHFIKYIIKLLSTL